MKLKIMSHLPLILILMCAINALTVLGQQPVPTINNELRAELLRMKDEDQAVRNKMTGDSFNDPDLLAQMSVIDKKNTARMKEIIQQYGWPGFNIVGKDGALSAWLLVQHADHDREFQKKCLALLKEAADRGNAAKPHLALLTDRVLLAEGKKQLYGTQFEVKDGEFVPLPIEDEVNVDARRKEVGLDTLEEYKQQLKQFYQPSDKSDKK